MRFPGIYTVSTLNEAHQMLNEQPIEIDSLLQQISNNVNEIAA